MFSLLHHLESPCCVFRHLLSVILSLSSSLAFFNILLSREIIGHEDCGATGEVVVTARRAVLHLFIDWRR